MPYVFYEELPEGCEEAQVVPVSEVDALRERVEQYEQQVFDMAERVDEAERATEKWKQERDDARRKYADAMLRPSSGMEPHRTQDEPELISGDLF